VTSAGASSASDGTSSAAQKISSNAAWPQNELSRGALAECAYNLPVGPQSLKKRGERRRHADQLLAWLENWPGQTWQQRWEASGSEAMGRAWSDAAAKLIVSSATASISLLVAQRAAVGGIHALLCLGVLRPGYQWLFGSYFNKTYQHLRELIDPGFFAEADAICGRAGIRQRHKMDALHHLNRVMLHTGRGPRHLTADDLLDYHAAVVAMGRQANSIALAWDLLRQLNVLPPGALSLRDARRRGQPSIVDLVDSYDLACRPVRDVLVHYLTERAPALDYSSLRTLAGNLVGAFWKDLEVHHPGINSLRLTPDVAEAWRRRATLKRRKGVEGGRARTDPYQVPFVVRAFYLDVAQWALEDPSWTAWSAPSPVRAEHLRGAQKHKRRQRAQMHQRTRTLAPVLSQLVRTVEERLDYLERLVAAASVVPVGGQVELEGDTFERIQAGIDRYTGTQGGARRLRVRRVCDGEQFDLTKDEDEAFWTWAIIETLRHTGIRLEELLELTHLALVTHRLPDTGEVVPLLQIAPSKQDAERLLLVSPDLAHVLARIVQRVRAGSEQVPLVARYDPHERVIGPPLPHLFQRHHGADVRVMAPSVVRRLLTLAIERAGLRGPDGRELYYTPHDFRRIFATEAVSGGLPVHIAAKLLGHRDLTTTQGYTAVYQEDVLRHYSAFIARRRAGRPGEEYREPTEAEWSEFERHFTRRKVELGSCARPYGTPCRHEHACLRCPMLRPDPAQARRLSQIISNLQDRIDEATRRGWLGEVEGLEVSLAGARQKLEQMRKIRRQTTVLHFGNPEP
jgi:integrase